LVEIKAPTVTLFLQLNKKAMEIAVKHEIKMMEEFSKTISNKGLMSNIYNKMSLSQIRKIVTRELSGDEFCSWYLVDDG
jgi:hypothetical protein